MAGLPLIPSKELVRWKSLLDPVIAVPIVNGLQLDGLKVVSGVNTINHTLGRKLQGYQIVMNDSAVTFHDNQSTNTMPQLTLLLVASGNATISLLVY